MEPVYIASACHRFARDIRQRRCGEAPALFFAYDYHAGSVSLREYHCDHGTNFVPAREADLWSYASQLCCVIKAVHGAGLAVGAQQL